MPDEPNRASPDQWRSGALQSIAEAEVDRQPLIDCHDLLGRKLTEQAADPTLVDRPKLIDERERPLRETALPGRQGWIQEPLAWSTRDRYDTNEREALVTGDVWITDDDAGPYTALFVSDRGIEFDHHHGSTAKPHV
jgi:hypothetical protein